MRQYFHNLPARTYEGQFLWKVALALIALGIGVGFAVHHLVPRSPQVIVQQMIRELESMPPGIPPVEDQSPEENRNRDIKLSNTDGADAFTAQLDDWAYQLTFGSSSPRVSNAVERSNFNDEQMRIAHLMIESITGGEEPVQALVDLAKSKPPTQYSQIALGFYWRARDYPFHAARSFELEDAAYRSGFARGHAVMLYTTAEAWDDLIRLLDNPDYAEPLEPLRNRLLRQKAIKEGDWPMILKQTLIDQHTGLSWQITLIAALTGAAWFAFLIHVGRLWRAPGDMALCAAGFLLGALSTTATLLMITLQEDFWGFEPKYDFVGGLMYCVAGIGLREEAIKLLFFVPLIPFLLRRKNPLLALLVAGCVGLGFATEENVSYFHQSMGLSGPGRFLTANFLHISATALSGYALYRAFATGWKGADYAATMFGMVVFAHGFYNAFLMLPALADYSIFAFSIYVLLCYQMFQVMDEVRSNQRQTISLSFVFTLSLSVVLAVCLGWAVSMVGFAGVQLIGVDLLGVATIVIMFFRVINEPIRS